MGYDYNFAKKENLYFTILHGWIFKKYISRLHMLLMYNDWMHAK